jgi:plastocyanin
MPPGVLIMLGRTISIALATLMAGCAAPAAQSASDTTAASVTGQPSMSAAPTLAFTVEEADEPPAGAIEILLTFGPKFEPEEVSASAGTIVFFLQNDQGDGPPATHNFWLGTSVDEPPLATSPVLSSGQAVVFTVEAVEPGTYTYWCTVPSPDGSPHSASGMVGTLTVTP